MHRDSLLLTWSPVQRFYRFCAARDRLMALMFENLEVYQKAVNPSHYSEVPPLA